MLYRLEDRVAVAESNLIVWARWFETADRCVNRTELGDILVSTVFLGIDLNYAGGSPHIFETMIFGSESEQVYRRCSMWEEAERYHAEAVALCQTTLN